MRRFATVAATLLLAGSATACLSGPGGCIRLDRPPAFNPRLRLDRGGLSDEQRRRDPGYGPYRDALETPRGELISELTPVLPGADKLLQSDCLWLATGEDPEMPVDAVAGSWEMVLDLRDDHPAFDTVGGSSVWGACFPRDPVEGLPVVVCSPESPRVQGKPTFEEFCAPAEDERRFDYEVVSRLIFNLDDCLVLNPASPDLGLVRDDTLIEAPWLEAVAPVDSSGDCPARVAPPPPPASDWLLTAGLVEHRVGRFDGEVRALGKRSGCIARELLTPGSDASYRLVVRSIDPATPDVVDWLGPNILTVPGRRTIRRAMSRVGDTELYAWQTEVDRASGGGEGGRRWSENFSPHAVVEAVRIYKEGPGGGRQPAAGGLPLRLQGDYGGAASVSWQCEERIDEGDATSFPIHLEDGSPDCDVRVENREGTTPTYPLEFLDLAAGPIEQPLRWEVETEGVDHDADNVWLEFELRTVRDGAFLQAQGALDLGPVALGRSASGLVSVENVGENAVRLDGIALHGPGAADFGLRPLGERIWLAAPWELAPSASGDVWELSAVPGFEDEPELFDLAEVYGTSDLVLTAADHAGGTVELYGAEVSFAAGEPVLVDPLAEPSLAPIHPLGLLPFGRWGRRAATLPRVLPPGASLQVAVTAAPSAYGARQAYLRFEYAQASDPSVTGWVETALAAEGISGPRAGLVGVPLSAVAGGERRVALQSLGNQPLVRSAITLSGPDAGDFSVVGAHPPVQVLAPGEVEVFAVRYEPATLPAFDQPAAATLELATDAGTVEVGLIGRSPLATRPELHFTRAEPAQPVYLDNLSPEPIERAAATLSGPDHDFFALVPEPASPATIGPRRNELQLVVRYRLDCSLPAPLSGRREAELTLDTDVGPVRIALTGEHTEEDCP